MRHRSTGLFVVLAATAMVASCGLLDRVVDRPTPTWSPFPIPTSASTPSGDTVIEAVMQPDGPCLAVVVIEDNEAGERILPIWPVGFTAEAADGFGFVLKGPLGTARDAIVAERLELHGQYLESPPSDSTVPPECVDYRLFLVGEALNIAT